MGREVSTKNCRADNIQKQLKDTFTKIVESEIPKEYVIQIESEVDF